MTACAVCGVEVESPCYPHEPECPYVFGGLDFKGCDCPTPPVCPDHCSLCDVNGLDDLMDADPSELGRPIDDMMRDRPLPAEPLPDDEIAYLVAWYGNRPEQRDRHEARLVATVEQVRRERDAAYAMVLEANEAFDECTGQHAKELVADEPWRVYRRTAGADAIRRAQYEEDSGR